MIAYYTEKPEIFVPVGNGSYLYHYDISKEESEFEDRTQVTFVCEEVIVWDLSSDNVLRAVLVDKWDDNYQQKLINDYNSVSLGLYDQEKSELYTQRYIEFLQERNRIKQQVETDFKNWRQ